MTEPKISQCQGIRGGDEVSALIRSTCQKLYDRGLSRLYADVSFKVLPISYNGSLCEFDAASDSITFSLNHFHPCRLDFLIYKALGQRRWNQMSNLEKLTWECKHVPAEDTITQKVQDLLKEGTPYEDILETFNSAVPKLQVIHLLNALVASNVHPETAKRIDLKGHPATQALANRDRLFSLTPLLSAYASQELMLFPYAVGHLFITEGNLPITEDSTRVKLQELVESLI